VTPRHSLREALRATFFERLPYKVAALFFAVVLWLVVSGEERTEAIVTLRFSPRADPSLGALQEVPRVRALVEGRGRDIIKLFASPPVLRPTFGPETPPVFEYRVSSRDVRLPEDVSVIVRDLRPRRVTLRFAAARGEETRSPGAVADTVAQDTLPLQEDSVSDSLPEPRR
jgi:hypothetical protein